ncbi:MAG: AAA family ATPase, partial [Candidatus Krumholzibacteriota bacterium]|nr:AAA family ATPase [Candidatus Krumholzibacteriota bacterium]
EIEKAHPDVFNVLLQLLDDGRLTDSRGHVVDFKNTIVIMTSNLGSRFLQERERLGEKELSELMTGALREFFRPEFLNRVDGIVTFDFLTREETARIVDFQVAKINERLAEQRLVLQLTPRALAEIAERGYDPAFGARPLKRLLQSLVLDPLARLLIEEKIHEGDTVTADWKDGELSFTAA